MISFLKIFEGELQPCFLITRDIGRDARVSVVNLIVTSNQLSRIVSIDGVPSYGDLNRSDTSQFSIFSLRVNPANDQVIVVESLKKYAFIDVVVYIVS